MQHDVIFLLTQQENPRRQCMGASVWLFQLNQVKTSDGQHITMLVLLDFAANFSEQHLVSEFLSLSNFCNVYKCYKFSSQCAASAARVTVLGLCVCVCVCVCVSTLIPALRATKRMMSDTNGFCVTSARKIKWRFS